MDSGYENVGLSLKTASCELRSAEYRLLSDEKERHDDRRMYRRTRRNRLRYRAPRFDNRKKPEGWIAPSLQHKIEAQASLVMKICSVAPVTRVVVEVGVFDPALLAAMQTTGIPPKGIDYQHGPLYYHDNLRAAVFQRDHYTCKICGKDALKHKNVRLCLHHALYWKNRHADTLNECITVCSDCHSSKNHAPGGKLWGLEPRVPRLEGATFMNVARWKLVNMLRDALPGVEVRHAYGSETARTRKDLGLGKSHANDAYCIGDFHPAERAGTEYFIKKRRNNRILEKFYDAKIVDVRNGTTRSGKDLGCNRTNRREPRNSDRSLRIYRGKTVRHGYRSIRRRRPILHVGDTVAYKFQKYPVIGTSLSKAGHLSVLLLKKENSPTDRAIKPSINKICLVRQCDGWQKLPALLPAINDGVSEPGK